MCRHLWASAHTQPSSFTQCLVQNFLKSDCLQWQPTHEVCWVWALSQLFKNYMNEHVNGALALHACHCSLTSPACSSGTYIVLYLKIHLNTLQCHSPFSSSSLSFPIFPKEMYTLVSCNCVWSGVQEFLMFIKRDGRAPTNCSANALHRLCGITKSPFQDLSCPSSPVAYLPEVLNMLRTNWSLLD